MKLHPLALVAIIGGLLSAGCLSGAHKLATANDSKSTAAITREIPWDGSRVLVVDLPANVRYVQGQPGMLRARGAHRTVSTLSIDGGRVHDKLLHTGDAVDIEITAPDIAHFELNGRSRLVIEGYNQDQLSLRTQGAATVEAAGRASGASVFMQGRSDINLSGLSLQTIDGSVGGTGVLVVAPTRGGTLEVRNLASAVLLTRPLELKTTLLDEGRVIEAPAR
jgi:Putative auto-transporter adhesin, head GIN domain